MKPKIKPILIGVLIGVVAFPTIAIGGSFTVSLIQGKSIPEAIQILAQQIDSLIGRVETLENRADKEEACREANEIRSISSIYNDIFNTKQKLELAESEEQISELQAYLEKFQELKVEKIKKIGICEQLDSSQLIKREACERANWIERKLEQELLSQLRQYENSIEDYEMLCSPTHEGIEAYCNKLLENNVYENQGIIHCWVWSEKFRNCPEGSEHYMSDGLCYYGEIDKERIIRSLTEEDYPYGYPANGFCNNEHIINEFQNAQIGIRQIRELEQEYSIQKGLCGE